MKMTQIKLSCRSAMHVALLVGALALSGCVTIPASIKGTSPNPAENLVSVRNAPEMYIGQEGRFGGKVISVFNEPEKTRLEIAVMPLNKYDAAPELNTVSEGRLYAYVNSFLEPTDFTGKYVTVVGTITGEKAGKIGEIPYNYITLAVTGLQRWNVMQRVMFPPVGPLGYGYYDYPPYYSHFYDPQQPWNWEPGYGYPVGSAAVATYLAQ
ncbi:Slp family lipoprotein [Moellerella wisconsensis]|uniref:Slp family lipoprotein n=1 Tax=Moellerella wisconsensis TaxID=158849 RepID=UPI00307642A1